MSTAAAPVVAKGRGLLSAMDFERSWARQQPATRHWRCATSAALKRSRQLARRHESRAIARDHFARQNIRPGGERRIESPGHTPADECRCAASMSARAPRAAALPADPLTASSVPSARDASARAAASRDQDGAASTARAETMPTTFNAWFRAVQGAVRRQRPKRKVAAIA